MKLVDEEFLLETFYFYMHFFLLTYMILIYFGDVSSLAKRDVEIHDVHYGLV